MRRHAVAPAPSRALRTIQRFGGVDESDPLFRGLLASLTTLAAGFVLWVHVTPMPERVDLELIEDLHDLALVKVARLPLLEPPPLPPTVTPPPRAVPPRPSTAPPAPAPRGSLLVRLVGPNAQSTNPSATALFDDPAADARLADALGRVRIEEEVSLDPSVTRTGNVDRRDVGVGVGTLDGGGANTGDGAHVSTPKVTPPPEREVVVTAGEADVIGAVMRGAEGRITTCLEQSLKGNPRLDGRLGVGFTVTAGRVSGVHVVSNQTGDDALGACVVGAVRTFRFPSAVSAEVTEFPWILSGG